MLLQAFCVMNEDALYELEYQLRQHGFTADKVQAYGLYSPDHNEVKELITYQDLTYRLFKKPTVDAAPRFWKHSILHERSNHVTFNIETPDLLNTNTEGE